MANGTSESTDLGGVNLDVLDDEPQFETPQRNESDVELPEDSYVDDYDGDDSSEYGHEDDDDVTDYASNATPWYMRLWQNDIARRATLGVGALALVVGVFTITNSMTSDEASEKGSGEVVAPEKLSSDDIASRGQSDEDEDTDRSSRFVDEDEDEDSSEASTSSSPAGVSRVGSPGDVYEGIEDEPADEPEPQPEPVPQPAPPPAPRPPPEPQPQPQPAPQPAPQPQPAPKPSQKPEPDTSRANLFKRLVDGMGNESTETEKKQRPEQPQPKVNETGAVETVYQTPDR